MQPRWWALLVYGALIVTFSAVGVVAYSNILHMQEKGVPSVARLLSYYEAGAGRAGSTAVFGRVAFKVGGQSITSAVVIGTAANAADRSFSEAIKTGVVPIVYDPSHPTRVVYNGHDELAKRRPLELGVFIAIGGILIASLIFLPVIAAVWSG